MLSRIHTLRETWASSQRNVTLTVAAIITSAVSLLIFGLTLLIQHGFDNLLSKWEGGVEMIVFMQAGATDEQRSVVESALNQQRGVVVESWRYCDVQCSLAEAERFSPGIRSLWIC
jgi:cell division transport system permease protein